MGQAKKLLRDSFYMLNTELAGNNTKLDKKASIDIVYNDKSIAVDDKNSAANDFMDLNVVLCGYYVQGSSLKELIENLCQDLERTIYTRLDENNDELLKKRVLVKKSGVNYSVYSESKDKIEVI